MRDLLEELGRPVGDRRYGRVTDPRQVATLPHPVGCNRFRLE